MASKNDGGIWLDKETGKVVTSKPARGRQIVAPGKEMTPQVEALVELYKTNADERTVETATDKQPAETRDEPKPTSSKSRTKKGS